MLKKRTGLENIAKPNARKARLQQPAHCADDVFQGCPDDAFFSSNSAMLSDIFFVGQANFFDVV